jgi:hypothetical protein
MRNFMMRQIPESQLALRGDPNLFSLPRLSRTRSSPMFITLARVDGPLEEMLEAISHVPCWRHSSARTRASRGRRSASRSAG